MKKWNTFYDLIKIPLQILLVALVLQSIGGIIVNNNFVTLFKLEHSFLQPIALVIIQFSTTLIYASPIIFVTHVLYKKTDSSLPSIMFITLLILAHTITEAVNKPLLIDTNLVLNGILRPGVLFSTILGFVLYFTYKKSQERSTYSFLSFLNKDSWFILVSLLVGSLVCYLLALMINPTYQIIQSLVDVIGYDITNPVSLFLYGILEKLFSLLNVGYLIQNPFLFGSLGGTWIDSVSNNYVGDIPIWTAQVGQNIFGTGAGRFITPLYIINLFIIPAIVLAIHFKATDKIERRKTLPLILIVIVISFLGNNSLPIDLLLLFMAPGLFVFHWFYTGLLFGLLQGLNIFIGYASTNQKLVSVGNIFDLLVHVRVPVIQRSVIGIAIIGIISFVIYFYVFKLYYNKFALDPLQTGKKDQIIDDLIESFGGLKNIVLLTNTPFKLIVQFEDENLVEFHIMHKLGVFRITETKIGYHLYMGAESYIVAKLINQKRKHLG